jgi:hypothetical protein
MLQIYNRSTLPSLDWPTTPNGDYARRYLTPFIENLPPTYIRNVHTDLQILQSNDLILPMTSTLFHPGNSYVCSPYTHYITYGQEEFATLKNSPLEFLLKLLFIPIAAYFRQTNFDKVLLVNNWLLSTNLYPSMPADSLESILKHLITVFPDRPIIFRSVDTRKHALYGELLRLGCQMVFSRNVYYQDPTSAHVQQAKQYRIDLKHFQSTPYKILNAEQLNSADIPRLVQLYNALYLDKYSQYNPQFTEAFLKLALAQNLLTIKAFALDDRIDAVMGYFTRNGLATPPLFGYDTQLPKQLGLYRLLSTLMSTEALNQNLLVHFSAGVGRFKHLRGCLPSIEYNAVYDAHLPASRRRPWRLLKFLMDRVAIPIIRKYGF